MKQQNKLKKAKGGRSATYEEAFKIVVAREYLKGELGYMKLADKHGLPSADTARYFVDWYRTRYDIGSIISTVSKSEDQAVAPSSAGSEAALYKELEDARLKITALETIITIANKQFNIDILKNAGARQSKS